MTIKHGNNRDLYLRFELHCCQRWQTSDDLRAAINLLLDRAPLIPLERRMVPVGGGKRAFPAARDLPAWFAAGYQERGEWDAITFQWPDYQAGFVSQFRLALKDEWRVEEPVSGAKELSLDAYRFGDAYNVIDMLCALWGTSIAFQDRPSEIPQANTVARIYRDFARPLIDHLKPEYAIISDADHFNTYGRDVVASRLQCIHWGNYWGPSYLDRYGADLWRTPTIGKTESWGGGIWYQVTDDFRAFGLAERERINAHYAEQGIRAAQWIAYGE